MKNSISQHHSKIHINMEHSYNKHHTHMDINMEHSTNEHYTNIDINMEHSINWHHINMEPFYIKKLYYNFNTALSINNTSIVPYKHYYHITLVDLTYCLFTIKH